MLLTAVQERGKHILHVVWRDITERKQLENQLRQAQKMEAIGMLAGGIAHDFNNLLVAILGHTELMIPKVRDRQDLIEHLEQIHSAGNRAATLVRQLLTFSRKQELRLSNLDLKVVLGDLGKLLRRLIGEDVQLVTNCSPDPVLVLADPGQVEQVIINLATNARDAMPKGGTLSFEIRSIRVSDSVIGAVGKLVAGPYALLSVTDTGIGMDEETVRRAFDPFFTTKEVGKGTGLGLATVYGILDQSGGSVDIFSTPGRGTTVKVYFPIATLDRAQAPSAPRDLPAEGGTETILVAEDEVAVSTLVEKVLREKGYNVLLAADGAEALEIWRRHEEAIDLLLTDVVMPNMGGVDLVQELSQTDVLPPVIFASGYTNDALVRLREVNEEVDLLEKPFTPEELVGRVRLALDRHDRLPGEKQLVLLD